MLTIGEFSHATRLTVKTLRYYHDLGILVPVRVDAMTGYRYYDERSYDRAQAIMSLKDLGFSLLEIKTILETCGKEEDLRQFIRGKLREVRAQVEQYRQMEARLTVFEEHLENPAPDPGPSVEEITLNLPHFLAVKVRGPYDAIGDGFRQLYGKAGLHARGQPYGFYYDMEYTEENAVFEAVLEVRQELRIPGVECRSLENRAAVRLRYRGPYGGQGNAYMKLFGYCREKNYTPVPPVIEHYVKGPGMIFRGNPETYLTECIVLVER